ncbi:guanosine-3',5'-bis(diphosphate) 3'-pyrophosphohydrolase MESH1 isoform X1 [Dromaius novaehollandiae]|uniref:guanosine-3',5'-bis(diphosphate) 3'-pyrophosphohydrolase MESH1 isoform X1 n=1 Tax=Dromaius novaehollandiae TaxID=8790 RepID=UPI00311F688D
MGSEAARLLEAADFAAEKHKAQRRKDPEGTPYINHPLGVARILAQEAGVTDIVVLQAALLHDTVEDTDTTFSEIEERFGEEVRRVVEEVTDDKTLPKAERKRLQIEHAPGCSRRAKLVKLADKLHNLRDISRCTPAALPAAPLLLGGARGGPGSSAAARAGTARPIPFRRARNGPGPAPVPPPSPQRPRGLGESLPRPGLASPRPLPRAGAPGALLRAGGAGSRCRCRCRC